VTIPAEYLTLRFRLPGHLEDELGILLSGLLAAQEEAVVRELEKRGFRVGRSRILGEWIGLVVHHA